MGCEVYANGNEIACKAGDNKTIAEFPDVCLSPPSPPAGPVPVPYPNTSFSKDMQSGSKTVKIKNQEVMLKDQSFYKTSPLGNEAATRSFGASVVTHVITGKTYFVAWSMDVRFEDQNVDRHLDLTSSNHASVPGSPPPVVPSGATMTVRELKDSVKWSRHVDPHACGGKHDWDCGKDCKGKTSCPDCWQPRCEPNAEAEQNAYDGEQAKPNTEKAQNAKNNNSAKVAKGKMAPEGAACENAAIDSVGAANVESAGFRAHCKNCHMEGDLDIVTADSVIECKKSAKALDLEQMNEMIIPIAQKCHPGKQIKVAVPKSELGKLTKKLSQPAYRGLGLSPMGV